MMRRLQIAVIGLMLALLAVGAALAQGEPPKLEPIDANAILSPTPASSQSATAVVLSADCDSAALRAWLLSDQNTLQQTATLFRNSGRRDAGDVVNDLLSQLSVIETQPRPSCADAAMIWTYSLYATWIEGVVCRAQTDSACHDNVVSRAETAIIQTSTVFTGLLETAGLSPDDLTEISVDDFLIEGAVTPSPMPTLTPTSPRKTAPRAQTPEAPTPNAGRNSGSGRNAQARAIRSAIDSSLMVGRVNGVEVIDADSINELQGHVTGRGVIVAFSVSTLQQAAYPTDSILLMETVAAAINSNQFDLQFMIIVAFDPDSAAFSKASLVSISDILDYQAGRITRDQLLKSIENIDNNTLPQV